MDGRSMCAQYGRFTADDFVDFLKRVRRRFPKIVIILDRAPQHTAKVVKQLEGETEGLELKYLPPGCPDLNAMEEKWKQMKRHVLDVPYVTLGNSAERNNPLSAVPNAGLNATDGVPYVRFSYYLCPPEVPVGRRGSVAGPLESVILSLGLHGSDSARILGQK